MTGNDELTLAIRMLLRQAGFSGDFTYQALASGNNQVFRLEADGRPVVLKVYFRHVDDPRDRLGAEYAFARFAWDHGIRQVPQPLACDRANRLALNEFIVGRKLDASEVDAGAVQQAIDFYRELNRHRSAPEAQALPRGSEACFSLSAHRECVERRLQRLASLVPASEEDRQALAFVTGRVFPTWQALHQKIEKEARRLGLDWHAELASSERCLSPSDFGFHNALMDAHGRLRFFDFEYAGWDDPARLICDFFCQPAVPVPFVHLADFVEQLAAGIGSPRTIHERVRLLLPVYRVKWITIMLNEFLPVGERRRSFAQPGTSMGRRKEEQLEKTRRALDALAAFLS